jgi:hypothetical protein
MTKNILISFFITTFLPNLSLNNNNYDSINRIEKNVCGSFDNRSYEYITVNNHLEFTVHPYRDVTADIDYDPTLYSITLSLYNKENTPYIKQIRYIKTDSLAEKTIKEVRKKNSLYLSKDWYKIEITFSNEEKNMYLISKKSKIIMVDATLKIVNTLDFSKLDKEGLTITGVKDREKKTK